MIARQPLHPGRRVPSPAASGDDDGRSEFDEPLIRLLGVDGGD
jgi:hypothetical protein